jgi:hypothetical protein
LEYLEVHGRMIILKQIIICGMGMHGIDMVQDRDRCWALVNAVMNLRFPQNSENDLNSCGPVSFSGKVLLHGVSFMSCLCSFEEGFLFWLYLQIRGNVCSRRLALALLFQIFNRVQIMECI